MKTPLYNQLNPLIRIKETELLSEALYEQLLNAQTAEEVSSIFRNTVYSTYNAEDFIETCDTVLAKERAKMYEWLYEVAPEPELVSIYSSRYTFHNLKVLTKAQLTQQNLDHLFIFDGRYSIETLKSAIKTKKSNELEESIVEAILEVLEYLEESTVYQAIDIIYDRFFLTYQRELANKLPYKEVLDEIQTFIDLTNITTMARGIIQKQTKPFLSTVLSNDGKIPKDKLMAYSTETLDHFLEYILKTEYASLLLSTHYSEAQKIDFIEFERNKDTFLFKKFEKARVVAFGPLPLLALLHAKELEWKNIRLILVGKRGNFSIEQIKERMRKIDVL